MLNRTVRHIIEAGWIKFDSGRSLFETRLKFDDNQQLRNNRQMSLVVFRDPFSLYERP